LQASPWFQARMPGRQRRQPRRIGRWRVTAPRHVQVGPQQEE
jgi:hypothetical protein